jgi:hypothetical protein
MNTSLDGYIEDEQGNFNWGIADDQEAHLKICEHLSSFGVYLLRYAVRNRSE